MAKIEYQKKKSAISVHETMSDTDDWVIDTYGKDIARKFMDRAEHMEFIEPLSQDGVFARVKLDQRNICRVKYCPEKYVQVTDDKGIEHVRDEVHVKAMWKGLLDNGTIKEEKSVGHVCLCC
jgi:DNA-dependent RNA polymerase auxiliary subunit epsilon